MKTKALLGALVVAMLAVFGMVGLRSSENVNAGNTGGVTQLTPSAFAVGGQATGTITVWDDIGASTVTATITTGNAIFVASSASYVVGGAACAVNATGITTALLTLADANCDAGSTSEQLTWSVTILCNATGPVQIAVAPTLPGSVLPNTNTIMNGTCLATTPAGSSTISIKKVDQFGQYLTASFSIQQSPFWVEVARINLVNTVGPCDTSGGPSASCALPGFVTPQLFPTGLPPGTYRVVEVGVGNQWCTLTGVYSGYANTNTGAVNNPYWGSPVIQPITLTLPDANPLDLQLTFVNSCTVPGGPSAANSGIAVVIGGATQQLTNTANIEISPAPGSDDDARLDIRVRDAANVPIPNAHVTILIDNGVLAVRRDLSTFATSTTGGYEVIEPSTGTYGTNLGGDTCDQAINGWVQQSVSPSPSVGSITWPYFTSSPQAQDAYTNQDGLLSACVYVDSFLAGARAKPGKVNVQAIVDTTASGGLYPNGVSAGNPYYQFAGNLSQTNFLGAPNVVLTATITVVGPPASITVAAAPTSLNCGEKSTVTVTVKDSAGQNVSDHTRVEFVTNFGGVIGGTTATLGLQGGQVYPNSSSSAETFNGVATAYLLTSTEHVGPYEVVAAAGGSVLATNGQYAPWYTGQGGTSLTPTLNPISPWYTQGLFQYSPSSAPVNAQATVVCAVPGAVAAAPAITAPRTGQGPADGGFAIRPPNTGDAGLATSSSSSSWSLFGIAGLAMFALAGVATLRFARR